MATFSSIPSNYFLLSPNLIAIGTEEPTPIKSANAKLIITKGMARLTYVDAYQKIRTYIIEHHLSIKGYAYEESVIDEMAISSMDDFVAEILVQSNKRSFPDFIIIRYSSSFRKLFTRIWVLTLYTINTHIYNLLIFSLKGFHITSHYNSQ